MPSSPTVPTAAEVAAEIQRQQEAALNAKHKEVADEAAAWKAREPDLVKSIQARIEKRLNKDHTNGAELKVTLPGDEYRLIHEYCLRGIAPPGLSVDSIQHEFLMKTGKNVGGIKFVPDTSIA